MQRIYMLPLLLLFLGLRGGSSSAADLEEAKEPPLRFVVRVGDKTLTITEGETGRLDGTFANPVVSVTPLPDRVFRCQGVSFKYPRSFTFEADLTDTDAKNWTLSGNDFKIMYFVLNERVTPDEYAQDMIEEVGGENCKVTNASATINLGKQTLAGTTIQMTLAGHTMVMDIYRIPSPGAVTRLLVFQDSLNAAGSRSHEGKQTLKGLESSFAVER